MSEEREEYIELIKTTYGEEYFDRNRKRIEKVADSKNEDFEDFEGIEDFEELRQTCNNLSYRIAQLEHRVGELESGKPRTIWECMNMDSKRFEKLVTRGELSKLKPTELRAIRIYQHRDECKSKLRVADSNMFILRTQEAKIKQMLARYEKGVAPDSRAIVRAMKAVVINHPLYEGNHDRSPIANGVLELRTRDNLVVYRRNRQLIHPEGSAEVKYIRGKGQQLSWFVGSQHKGESLLLFKEQNNHVDIEEEYARLFEFPITEGNDSSITT